MSAVSFYYHLKLISLKNRALILIMYQKTVFLYVIGVLCRKSQFKIMFCVKLVCFMRYDTIETANRHTFLRG